MAVVSKPKKTTSKKTIASILIEVRSDAEKFWETNLYPRLGYDGKGDCLSKYARLRNGWSDTSSAKVNPELSHGEIMKACELYGNQFPDPIEKLTWGLKRFMDYDTIKEMLNGNFPHPLGKNKSNLQATQEKILLAYGTDAETFNHGMAIMRGEI